MPPVNLSRQPGREYCWEDGGESFPKYICSVIEP